MIGLEDRRTLTRHIEEAHQAGARLRLACETAGIDARTLQRWKARCARTLKREVTGDGRPQAVHPRPRHDLSQAERVGLLRMAALPTCHPRASCLCSLTRASTWPASRASVACCANMAKVVIAGAHARPDQCAHPPRTLPRPCARCGAGT